MSTLKRKKVVMLPTNEKAKIAKDVKTGEIGKVLNSYANNAVNLDFGSNQVYLRYCSGDKPEGLMCKFQELYFLSDEEIKEGDWILHSSHGISNIYKAEKIVGKSIVIKKGESSCWEDYSKKIFATTDKSLNLPQPSDSFIEKYVESYNKGCPIEYVMVQYEAIGKTNNQGVWNAMQSNVFGAKVDKNNTITIRPIKDNWSREEVIQLLNYFDAAVLSEQGFNIGKNWKEKWLEENL